MSFVFRPAVRENVGLFIGLAGGTGSGKTWSAMKMATGIVGVGNKFCVIDTENKRASHYADTFNFDVADFEPPFSSMRYEEAVKAAFDAGYKAIIVDQFSYEHDGEGGYLDSQSHDLNERVKRYMTKYPNTNEFQAMEKLTPSSWIKPKQDRKRMLQTLLRCSATVPIIFTFRADEKTFHSVDGKLVARKTPVWEPICGKGMPFEMTVFLMLLAEAPGIPIFPPIKLQEQHKSFFPPNKPINEESGKVIAEWAAGDKAKAATQTSTDERKQYLKSIQDSLVKVWPGKSAADTKAKVGMIARAFNGASWKDLEKMDTDALRVAAYRFIHFSEEIEGGSFEQLTEEVAIQAWAKVVMTEDGE